MTPDTQLTADDVTAAALTDELAAARRHAARAIDRSSALADLRLRLLEMGNRHHRGVTLEELFTEAEGRGELQLAELRAICNRITGDTFDAPTTIQED